MTAQNTTKGIWPMIATTAIFAVQDGISGYLGREYNVLMIIMIRYWVFATVVVTWSVRHAGSLRAAAATTQPWMQGFRGVLLAAEVCTMVAGFVLLGLVESHAVFACYPLLIAALSGPVLGEKVGWRRWAAIGAGFVGILVILEPGVAVFSPAALVPLAAALMFALYGLLTRYAARRDTTATSFFWIAWVGAVVLTPPGLWLWEPIQSSDLMWLVLLCILAPLGHYCLILCYEVAEASAVQPFAYLQLIFASGIGIAVFGETIRANVAIGAAITVAAGIFTILREHRRRRRATRTAGV